MNVCVRSWRARVGMAALTGMALLGAAGLFTLGTSEASNPTTPPTSATPAPAEAIADARSLSQTFRAAAEKVLPSVVAIRVTAQPVKATAQEKTPEITPDKHPFGEDSPFGELFRGPEMRRFFRELPSTPQPPRRSGMGSGVVIDESGLILTNNHVVAGDGKIMVRLNDGREYPAVEVRRDPQTDLAVVRIEGASGLIPVEMGNSDDMEIGDWVLALGQPFGLEGSVTAGIISGKARGIGITDRENFLQTDAAINPGNSGGPLVNIYGQLVGINTAISSRSGGNEGIGFAVPVNQARWVAEQLVDGGKVSRAFLGIGIQPVTHELAEQFGVAAREGVLVTQVTPDSAAAKAGVEPGDVIVEFAGTKITEPRQLQSVVEQAKIGTKYPLVVMRGGKRTELTVTCQEQPAELATAMGHQDTPSSAAPSSFDGLGLQVAPLDRETAQQFGIEAGAGVMITAVEPGSAAAAAGLTSGMVIAQADHKPVASVDDFRAVVESHDGDKGLLLLVRTTAGNRFVVVETQA